MPPISQPYQKTEIAKAMEMKNKSIKKFQDAKERSMAIMSSGRDATLMVSALITGKPGYIDDTDLLEKEIKKWRKFFFYEIYGTDPDEELLQEAKMTRPPKEILGF